MRSVIKRTKRVTFVSLLIKALCVSLVLSLLFAQGFKKYLRDRAGREAADEVYLNLSNIQRYIAETDGYTDPDLRMRQITGCITAYTQSYIGIEDPLSGRSGNTVHILSRFSPGTHTAAVLFDENGNVAASNRLKLICHIMFGNTGEDDPDKGFYICDDKNTDIPGISQMYEDFRLLSEKERLRRGVTIETESIYVNRKNRTFIPHIGRMSLVDIGGSTDPLIEESERTVIDSREINITVNDPDYELIENPSSLSGRPRSMFMDFFGERQEYVGVFEDESYYSRADLYRTGMNSGENSVIFGAASPVLINGKEYRLIVYLTVNMNDPTMLAMHRKWVTVFAAAFMLISLLYIWRRNVINKADYAFEDYRRDLTNHLAHDLKTPLTAIGGYAENIMEGSLSDEENRRYLSSIMENVGFMDSLISRTLLLNGADSGKMIRSERIGVKSTVESAFRKYAPLLEEKNITFGTEGDAQLNADRTAFETIIENLISNAVKYTQPYGTIKAAADSRHLVITNTVSEKADVRRLKHPFERGDKARSNVSGSGLGLSIAEHAASVSGFSLTLSCTDSEFRAELKL